MNSNCLECGQQMTPKPVPGATNFPRRLECSTHGYFQERRSKLLEQVDWREGLKDVDNFDNEHSRDQ